MIIRLPNTGETIDTERFDGTQDKRAEIEEKARRSFAGYTKGTDKAYCYQDALGYLDSLNIVIHEKHDFDNMQRRIIHDIVDCWIDDGDLPGKMDLDYDYEFCQQCYDEGYEEKKFLGHNYKGVESHSHEENNVMLILTYIIGAVFDEYRERTYGLRAKV